MPGALIRAGFGRSPCCVKFFGDQVRYGYPPEVTGHAERAAAVMLAAVTSGTEPFGQVCRNWLAMVPGA